MANGTIIGGALGVAGFVETEGSGLNVGEDGSARSYRVYQGAPANVKSFLDSFPEGTQDPEFTDLTRTQYANVTYQGGWAFIELEFGGTLFDVPGLRPFRLTKELVERSVSLNLSPGITGANSEGVYSLKYTTLAHTVEYTHGSDPGSPIKETAAALPATAENGLLFNLIDPPIDIGAAEYLGGGLNAPAGRTKLLTEGTDYQAFAQPIDFYRSQDRGELWECRETWAIIAAPKE